MALTPTTASTASTSNTGQTYRGPFAIIQYITNLTASTWFDYEPQVTATGSVANVSLPLNNESQKFFLVKPAF
jgi:hypothetical protein